jgi:L-glutamine---4-(methylsulfanyl)-2-oxobutanoate aminotransferase
MCCPMKSLNPYAGEIPVSAIHTMTEVAYEYDAINLSQGFPSFTPPKALTDRLSEVTHGGPNQYAISYGAANFPRGADAEGQPLHEDGLRPR